MDENKETRRWHASWIIATLVVVLVAALTGWMVLDMLTLSLTIAFAWALVLLLLWLATPRLAHLGWKIWASVVLSGLAIWALFWVNKYDRPILSGTVGQVVANIGDEESLIYVEALVTNTGHQNSYAKDWHFKITTDSQTLNGVQKFGEKRPDGTVDEPQLFDQEFPVGKPVRGWLYFRIYGVSRARMHEIFDCVAPQHNAQAVLAFTDTKEEHPWVEIRSVSEMIRAGCTPPVVPRELPPAVEPKVKVHGNHAPPATPQSPAPVDQSASLVHNQGTIGSVVIIDSSVSGNPGMSVFGEPKGGTFGGVSMNNVHLVGVPGPTLWEQFLQHVQTIGVPGNEALIQTSTDQFLEKVKGELAALPDTPISRPNKVQCLKEVNDAATKIISSATDEKSTVDALRKNPPGCLKQP